MSRNKTVNDSSLDLFLDTICNTFGGILFISLLVVILLNSTSREIIYAPPEEIKQSELIIAEQIHAENQAEIKRLSRVLAQKEKLHKEFVDPETASLAQNLNQLQVKKKELQKEIQLSLDQIALSQIETNKIAQRMKDTRDKTAQARKALAAVQEKLRRELITRTRSAKLPQQHSTNKTQVGFFLKQGRLCAIASIDASGNLSFNNDECKMITDSDNKTYLEPIPTKGRVVNPKGDNLQFISKTFTSFDPRQHFLTIFVSKDSFAHFVTIKDSIVRMGFEYQLVPWNESNKIYYGTTSGQNMVQ